MVIVMNIACVIVVLLVILGETTIPVNKIIQRNENWINAMYIILALCKLDCYVVLYLKLSLALSA